MSNRSNRLRVLATGILFAGVFFLPWWLVCLFGVFLTFRYQRYYEVLPAALLFDLLYSAKGVGLSGFALSTTLIAVVVVWLAEESKRNIRRI